MSAKYPRTPHLPTSPGGTSDDRRMLDVDGLVNCDVVITEKMDGSNVCLTASDVFARSHAGPPTHPSFDALKAMHASIRHLVDEDISIFGEWLYAMHSIKYTKLPSLLLVFGVRDDRTGEWWSWDDVELMADFLGVETAPVLAKTRFSSRGELFEFVDRIAREQSVCGGDREGVVVRTESEFHDDDFANRVGKWVRADHVQTDSHWRQGEIKRNRLVK